VSGPNVKRVLIADADEGTRATVRLTLSGDSYEVVEAADTGEALLVIARDRPEVLILDANLPTAGGLKICRSVKAQEETRHARVVLLTDKADPVDGEVAEEAGVDEFLAKPFTAMSLLKKITELLEGGAPGGS
jgi:two-component system cell cycle response regulator